MIVFNSAKTALQVRVLGPYQKVQAPEGARGQKESARHAADHHASVAVNSEYLALGFEPGCAVAAEVNERIKQNPELKRLFFNVSSTPLPAEQIAKVVGHAAQLGLDEDRQRTVAGVLPALFEYWNAASGAPGLSDILQKVVDVPWWSILKSGGKPTVDFRLQLEKTELREFTSLGYALRGYSFPFVLHLNGKPAMRCSMGVVSSRPPLAACAGVVAVAAQRPDGRGPKVFLQLLSASPGRKRPARDLIGSRVKPG